MARFGEEKSLKQRMDFQQSQCKKVLNAFMARFGRRKKFETTDGFPTIPVQKVLKIWLDLSEEKSLKQRMDFQQSQCKKC